MNDVKLYIVRGLPGSGKSTFARKMLDKGLADVHYEADMYFIRNGKYMYDKSQIGKAHSWCQSQVKKALEQGKTVVVSNTFTQPWEMQDYLDFCKEKGLKYEVIRITTQFQSVHDLPPEAFRKFQARFKDFPGETLIK